MSTVTRRVGGAIAAALAAATLTGCAHPAAPPLESYHVTNTINGRSADCLDQGWRAAGWVCLRWRFTDRDGSTRTEGTVS